MNPSDLFDDARNDAFFKTTATKIQDKLRELRQSHPENSARRWGWELLQNAKDAAASPVRVEFNLEKAPVQRVIVSHSACPFQAKDLLYLIAQTSSKERPAEGTAPKTTGRYGTGFITTHLLSPIVKVSGVLDTPGQSCRQFAITLDRSGQTIDRLIEDLEKAFAIRDTLDVLPRIEHVDANALNTSFAYQLDEEALEVARTGFKDLRHSLPLTLAFTPGVGEVTLRPESRRFQVADRSELAGGIKLVAVEEASPGGSKVHTFAVASGRKTTLAVRLDISGGKPRVLPFDADTPRLFCNFPLIGSESFLLPVVVNSAYFYPNDTRSGLYLENESDNAVRENRAALAEIPDLLGQLLNLATTEEWFDRYYLAGFALPGTLTPKAKEWYKRVILGPTRSKLLVAPIVEAASGESKPLRNSLTGEDHHPLAWLPHDNKHEVRKGIWRFASVMPAFRNKLPKREHIHAWSQMAWEDCGQLEVARLVSKVSESESLEGLAERLSMSNAEAAQWLNDLVAFLVEHGYERLFGPHKARTQFIQPDGHYEWKQQDRKTPLLPNQQEVGIFRLKSELFLDEELDETLKDVAADLGHNYRAFLLDRRIFFEMPESGRTKTAKDLAHTIEDAVREKIKASDRSESTRRAFRTLYRWFEENDARAQSLFSGLYEDRHLLIPPDEAITLIRQAARVPELESQVETLRKELSALQASSTPSETTETLSEAEARQQAHHFVETWEAIKKELDRIETSESRRTAKDLSRLLLERPELFTHVSEASKEAYLRWLSLLERAKAQVREHLEAHPDYGGEWNDDPSFPTLIVGVTRHGRDIRLVVRPADGGFIVLYEQIERDVLEQPDSELWIEGDGIGPERLTLGKFANRLGVNRLPVRMPAGKPAILHLN